MADGDFLSGLLNLPGQALNGIGGLLSSVGNGLGDATNAGATDASSVLSRFLPSSGQASGMFSDPMRMALLQAGIGASQPSTTRAGVWGNMASGFGQGLLNSQDQMLKRQLLAGEVQKQNMANLSQIAPLVQAGILPQQAMTQALNRAGLGQAPVPGAPSPQGASVPGQAGSSGGAPAPMQPPPGPPNVAPQAAAQPAGAPSVPNQNVAPSAQPPMVNPNTGQPYPPVILQAAQTLHMTPQQVQAQYLTDPKGLEADVRKAAVEQNKAAIDLANTGPTEYDKAQGKGDAIQAIALNGGREIGNKLNANLSGLRQVAAAMPDEMYGPTGKLTQAGTNWAQSIGVDTSRPDADVAKALHARVEEMMLAGLNNERLGESEGSGSRAVPPQLAEAIHNEAGSFDMSKKGFLRALDTIGQNADYQVRRGDFMSDYVAAHGRWDTAGQKLLSDHIDKPFRVDAMRELGPDGLPAPAGPPMPTKEQLNPPRLNGPVQATSGTSMPLPGMTGIAPAAAATAQRPAQPAVNVTKSGVKWSIQ